MRNKMTFVIAFFLIISFYGCNYTTHDFIINDSLITNDRMITDTNLIKKYILSNDTISGFLFWSSSFKENFSNLSFYAIARNRFDTSFMNNYPSKYYLIDSVMLNKNIAYLILTNYKMYWRKGYDRTLYLSIYNNTKHLKTYIVAQNSICSDGYVGGEINLKSKLSNRNILTTYEHSSSFLDIGAQHQEDSIITMYDLNSFRIIKTDTVKHIGHVDF